jgi:hypothetical protein
LERYDTSTTITLACTRTACTVPLKGISHAFSFSRCLAPAHANLEPSRVMSIISNCIVSSCLASYTSSCLKVLTCSSFHFVAISLLSLSRRALLLISRYKTPSSNQYTHSASTRPDSTASGNSRSRATAASFVPRWRFCNCARPRLAKCKTRGMRAAMSSHPILISRGAFPDRLADAHVHYGPGPHSPQHIHLSLKDL